jgi:hypothetical protein
MLLSAVVARGPVGVEEHPQPCRGASLSSEPEGKEILQTVSGILPTVAAKFQPLVTTQLPLDPSASLLNAFTLPWSHCVRLMTALPDAGTLRREILATKHALET